MGKPAKVGKPRPLCFLLVISFLPSPVTRPFGIPALASGHRLELWVFRHAYTAAEHFGMLQFLPMPTLCLHGCADFVRKDSNSNRIPVPTPASIRLAPISQDGVFANTFPGPFVAQWIMCPNFPVAGAWRIEQSFPSRPKLTSLRFSILGMRAICQRARVESLTSTSRSIDHPAYLGEAGGFMDI